MQTIGDRVKEVRGEMTQGEFAKRFGISQTKLSDIERGRSRPGVEFLTQLASQFEIDLNWLVTGKRETAVAREDRNIYGTTTEHQQLAADLARHPHLAAIVRKLVVADDAFLRRAKSLSEALDIPEEFAMLVLLKKEKRT